MEEYTQNTFYLIINGDEKNDFDGKLSCHISMGKDKQKTHTLYFNLNNHNSAQENGLYGGQYLQMFKPHYMEMYFENEYEFTYEQENFTCTVYILFQL